MNNILSNTSQLLVGVFGLIFLVLALKLAAGAKKAQYADTARTSANAVVAMVFLAMGLGAIGFAAFGKTILTTFGIH